MSGPRRFNVVNVFVYLVIASGIYLSVQYLPLYWKEMKLEDLVKEESYGAKSKADETVRNAIIQTAQRQLQIQLEPEDISIERLPDRVRIHVIWKVTVEHPFQKTTSHRFDVQRETVFY